MAYTNRTHGNSKPTFQSDTLDPTYTSPAATGTTVNIAGPHLDFFKIMAIDNSSTAVNLAGELGTGGAVEAIIKCIQQLATVYVYQVENTTGQVSVAVYPTGAWATGTLQTALQGLGSSVGTGPVDLRGTTVGSSNFKLA